ncbi:Transcription factor fungi [Macrophomina phaseolina MS6]|nr:Transcription factor fungi [Macrophomina phaseolina MS6]
MYIVSSKKLEGLVLTLMHSVNHKPAPSTGAPESASVLDADLPASFGRISLENDETRYVSGDHWISILDGIAELKDHFEDDNLNAGASPAAGAATAEYQGPKLLFGCHSPTTRESILASLPQRPVTDRLVSKYFNSMDMASSIIHGPTFIREYETFWLAPSETPIMWIGLLFAVIALGTHFQQRETHFIHPSPQRHSVLEAYKDKVIECLVLGKYTKVGPYAIETLMLYFSLEHLPAADTRVDNWILVGIIVRLAMRVGYHRDPSHTPQIKPFQAEMRRRHWATIVQLDLMTSTQVGLPRMVNEAVCDTVEPRNLLDQDFDDQVVDLPPSRPDSDMTSILYLNARNKLMTVFGMITDLTTSTFPTSYRHVMRLDRTLHNTVAAIPSGLQLKALSQSITEPSETILRRIYLDMTFHKARCILHRKYLTAAQVNASYIYSRTSCIDAAVRILQHQDVLFRECQPGGLLHSGNWKITSVLNHDFLLAITILSLDLNGAMELASKSQLIETPMEQQRRENIIRSLNRSYNIWLQSANTSREARKAAEVLRIVLAKAQNSSISTPSHDQDDLDGEAATEATESEYMNSPLTLQPFLACDPGASTAIGTNICTTLDVASPSDYMEDLNDNVTSGVDFDWDNWDSHFRGQNTPNMSTMDLRFPNLDYPTDGRGSDGCI